jgi:hypothetical protein
MYRELHSIQDGISTGQHSCSISAQRTIVVTEFGYCIVYRCPIEFLIKAASQHIVWKAVP